MTQDVAAARVDLERLAKLADAMPNDWGWYILKDSIVRSGGAIQPDLIAVVPNDDFREYFCAVHPATIRALLARVAALEEGIAAALMHYEDHTVDVSDAFDEAASVLRRTIQTDNQKGGGA